MQQPADHNETYGHSQCRGLTKLPYTAPRTSTKASLSPRHWPWPLDDSTCGYRSRCELRIRQSTGARRMLVLALLHLPVALRSASTPRAGGGGGRIVYRPPGPRGCPECTAEPDTPKHTMRNWINAHTQQATNNYYDKMRAICWFALLICCFATEATDLTAQRRKLLHFKRSYRAEVSFWPGMGSQLQGGM